jgi:hypothetical protein
MMKELDLLKKDWKKNENSFQQVSELEIYKMIHKKSSSIVKWILIISVLEFLILRGLDFLILLDDEYVKKMEVAHLYNFEIILTAFNYVIIIVFIYLFYKNFKNINTVSSTKKLMDDILKTRKTVKYYVWYNLLLVAISSITVVFTEMEYNKILHKYYQNHQLALTLISILIILVLFLIFWLFYKLLYGILLRKLYRNYNELKKIDL